MIRGFSGWAGKAVFVSFTAVLALSLGCPATAGVRYRVGLSYVDGLADLADQFEDNFVVDEGDPTVDLDTYVPPIGLTLFGYYQWDNGLIIGPAFGPFTFVLVEGLEDDHYYWQLPLSMNFGYVLAPDDPVSFYFRVGPSYHLANGSFVEEGNVSNLGVVAAIGLEFFQSEHFRMGVEAAYDSATVELTNERRGGTEEFRSSEFSFGLFFLFK
ncbi:MAG: hypothetical protein JW955_04355 [Sedimentisphaerales bacterium]|nr:hypothetical protein [Sedimentisphaerales bacterium]